eukprot:3000156-Prymnesium_polylepis.2
MAAATCSAWASPAAFSSMSLLPCSRPSAFHTVSPCRTSRSCVLSIVPALAAARMDDGSVCEGCRVDRAPARVDRVY